MPRKDLYNMGKRATLVKNKLSCIVYFEVQKPETKIPGDGGGGAVFCTNGGAQEWSKSFHSERATKFYAESRNGIRTASLVGFLPRIISIIFLVNEIVFAML